MAILHCYFDESGKMADHPAVSFTGVCVSHNRLQAFDDDWSALLRQYEIPALHMAKASRLKESYGPKMPRHQELEERIDALIPFTDCINDGLEVGLVQAVDVRDFETFVNEAKKGVGGPENAHYLVFVRGLLEILNYTMNGEKIALICDDDESTAWTCYSHYRAIRRKWPEVREKVVALTFANDELFPALQAADMLAFLTRMEAKKVFCGEFNMFGRLYESMTRDNGARGMQWFEMFADKEKLDGLGKAWGALKPQKKKKKK